MRKKSFAITKISKAIYSYKKTLTNITQWQKIYLLNFSPFSLEVFRQAKKQEISNLAAFTIILAILISPFVIILPTFIGVGIAGKLLR